MLGEDLVGELEELGLLAFRQLAELDRRLLLAEGGALVDLQLVAGKMIRPERDRAFELRRARRRAVWPGRP